VNFSDTFQLSNFPEVWEGTQSLVDRIRVRSGLSTTEDFSKRYGQPARVVAQLCMFSPYSPSFLRDKMGEIKLLPFAHAKGAFHRSIMHAQAAVQSCDGRYFGQNLSSSERRRAEPEYKYAAFMVALFGSFEVSYSQFSTINEHGEEWSPFRTEETAFDFLQRTRSRTFTHRLRAAPLAIAPGSVASRYIDRRWFEDFTDQVLTDMYTALAARPLAEKNEPVLLEVIRITGKAVDAQQIAQRTASSIPEALLPETALEPSLRQETVPDIPGVSPPTPSTPESEPEQQTEEIARVVEKKHRKKSSPPTEAQVSLFTEDSGSATPPVLEMMSPSIRQLLELIRSDISTGKYLATQYIKRTEDNLSVKKELFVRYAVPAHAVVSEFQKLGLFKSTNANEILFKKEIADLVLPHLEVEPTSDNSFT
jgi:hypothetical protein